jgi:hypothetical protein
MSEPMDEPETDEREEHERWAMCAAAQWLIAYGRLTAEEAEALRLVMARFDKPMPVAEDNDVAF